MTQLDDKLLKRFLKRAVGCLSGDWVLLGGNVLPALGRSYRSTTDIDFVPTEQAGVDQSLKIMEICDELGLPIETVNGAASFFLHRIKNFKKHLILLEKGEKCRIYRPDAQLYIQLKMGRMSESDLTDCLEMLEFKSEELTSQGRQFLINEILKKQLIERGTPKGDRYLKLKDAF